MTLPKILTLPSLAILLTLGFCATDLMAQRGQQQRGQQRGGQRGGTTSDTALLGMPEIQEHLEMTDDQIESIKEGNPNQMDRREMLQKLRDMDREERTEAFRELRDEQEASTKEWLEGILLSHQMERLEEIKFQNAARQGVRSRTFIQMLEITEEQQTEMREKATELEQMIAKETAELRKEGTEKIMDEVLTSKQKKKYEELKGEDFEMPAPQRRGADRGGRGGADGGGRGGRGGDRGGRGGRRGGGDGGADF